MFEVRTREVPEAKIVSITRRVTQPELPTFIPEAHGALRAHLAAQGAAPEDVDLAFYHSMVTADAEGTVEVATPFTGSVEPAGEIAVRIEPAHREAYATITRGQVKVPDILHAYDAVHSWLAEQGKQAAGSEREVYFPASTWDELGDDDPACDIAIPFRP